MIATNVSVLGESSRVLLEFADRDEMERFRLHVGQMPDPLQSGPSAFSLYKLLGEMLDED